MLEKAVTSPKQAELKYQALRLYHSNQISLSDIKAQFRIVTAVADDEYSSKTDQKDVLGARDRLERIRKLTMTRSAKVMEYTLAKKVKPRLTNTRAEEIAKFGTRYPTGIPANFSRYGILRAKNKKRAPYRAGSSRGKIARTRYYGFKQFNQSWDEMEKGLLQLVRSGQRNRQQLQKQLNLARKGIGVKVSRGG